MINILSLGMLVACLSSLYYVCLLFQRVNFTVTLTTDSHSSLIIYTILIRSTDCSGSGGGGT